MKTKRVLAALALAVALVGCKKQQQADDEKPTRTPMLSEGQRTQAETACVDYVTKLCVCATMKPENENLAKRCKLDKALPDALHVAIGVDADPSADGPAVASAQAQVKKILQTCVEGVNEMLRSAEFANCL